MTPREQGLESEAGLLREYWELMASSAYKGENLPRGSGGSVLVLPGLFGTDAYLRPLRRWLRRIGYAPVRSKLMVNAGCSKRLLDRLTRTVSSGVESGNPVAIIGHSRGGVLGRALAGHLGARCSHFIAVGSPIGGMLRAGMEGMREAASRPNAFAHSHVFRAGRLAQRVMDPSCQAPECGCAYFDHLFADLSPDTKVTSIYSSEDAVVSPTQCPIDGALNVEVKGTHSGLVYNQSVFALIADALHT